MTKEIDKVLEVLFDIRGDKFYFKSYGGDLIQGLLQTEREGCVKRVHKLRINYIGKNYPQLNGDKYLIACDDSKKAIRED